jgi:integrase
MTKTEARDKLAEILKPVNASIEGVGPNVKEFLEKTFFPFLVRKWKPSTYSTNRERIMREIAGAFGDRLLASLTREELQSFLDQKAHLSHSTTGHIRWDLKQIFDVAMTEGFATKNPALMLFVPRACAKPKRRAMTPADVRKAINTLPLRERLIFKLATVAGLRPGEIFALRRDRVLDQVVDVQQRIYRGKIDTPKTRRSVRHVALASIVREDLEAWLVSSPGGPEAWLFPSERLTTPISKDNLMNRYMKPALKKARTWLGEFSSDAPYLFVVNAQRGWRGSESRG